MQCLVFRLYLKIFASRIVFPRPTDYLNEMNKNTTGEIDCGEALDVEQKELPKKR